MWLMELEKKRLVVGYLRWHELEDDSFLWSSWHKSWLKNIYANVFPYFSCFVRKILQLLALISNSRDGNWQTIIIHFFQSQIVILVVIQA